MALTFFAHMASCGPISSPAGVKLMKFRVVDGAFRTSIHQGVNVVSPIYDSLKNEIRLSCARNETIGFYLILESSGAALTDLTLSADSLTSDHATLDVSAIKFFRVLSVDAGRLPGWHIKAINPLDRHSKIPDILVPASAPIGGQPYSLEAGQELLLWADIAIPTSCEPGSYFSAIRIHEGNTAIAHIPLLATVLPFALPDDTGVALLGPVNLQKLLGHHLEINGEPFAPDRVLKNGPLYEESIGLVRRTLVLAQQHRISPFLTGIYPVAKLDDRGELLVKWDDYDELIGDFLDSQLYPAQPKVKYWPIPFDGTFPPPPPYDPLSSPKYAQKLRQYLRLCDEHFAEQGWIDQAFMLLPPPTTGYTAEVFNTCRSYAGIARLASTTLPLVSLLPPQDLRPYGWEGYPFVDLTGYVDIWCPPAQFFDQTVFAQPQHRHTRKWLQLDRPPFSGSISLAAGDTFVRVIPWQAARLNAEAILLPTMNNWADDYDIRSTFDPPSGGSDPSSATGGLILPGRFCGLDTPLPTLRLKMLRRGMQDLAYLRLCQQKGLRQVRDILLQALCRFAGADAYGAHFEAARFDGWHRDPLWWNHARTLIAEQLSPPQAGPPRSLAWQDERLQSIEWQRFLEATQQVHLKPDGVRVNLRRRLGAAGIFFEVNLLLTIENHTRKPASALLSFGDLPMGWSAELDQVFINSIQPQGSRTITLGALASTIPAGDDGRLNIPVILQIDNQAKTTHTIQLSHITVRRPGKAILLDGDLSDWPLGIGNVVASFTTISTHRSGHEESRTIRQTGGDVIGWVCADNQNLYFAFHCLTPDRYVHQDAQKNFFTYEDRIPVGEEVLEILIDPTNGGSSSPSDLFHIGIKPSGAVLKERGIRSSPQVGYAEEWPADIKVATKILQDRWVAEVQVPLASFGPSATQQRTWAVNFCRFDLARWTYTTWSGAVWNPYLPISLGNMSFAN